MKINPRFLALAATAAAGVAVAALMTAPAASAWDWQALPNGYSGIQVFLPPDPQLGQCIDLHVAYTDADGYHETDLGSNCAAGFQQAFDAYIDSTICAVNPAEGQQHGLCLPPPTTTAAPDTTTAATTTAAPPATTTVDPVVTDAQPPAAAPAPAPAAAPETVTVTVTTVITDPAITSRLDLIDQRQATDEARIAALEHPTGLILGEPKNVAPFTNPN